MRIIGGDITSEAAGNGSGCRAIAAGPETFGTTPGLFPSCVPRAGPDSVCCSAGTFGRGFRIAAGVGVATGAAMRWRSSGFCWVCAGVGLAKAVNKTNRAKQLLFIKQYRSVPEFALWRLGLDSPMVVEVVNDYSRRLLLPEVPKFSRLFLFRSAKTKSLPRFWPRERLCL